MSYAAPLVFAFSLSPGAKNARKAKPAAGSSSASNSNNKNNALTTGSSAKPGAKKAPPAGKQGKKGDGGGTAGGGAGSRSGGGARARQNPEAQWEQMYQRLVQYKEKHGVRFGVAIGLLAPAMALSNSAVPHSAIFPCTYLYSVS